MLRRVGIFLADAWWRWLILTALILNGLLWVGIWRLFPHTPDGGPLHYTIYFGINLTGPWTELFILPGVGLLAIISHLIIGRAIKHVVWARLWGLLSVMINALAIIAAATVIYLVKINSS